MKDSWVVSAAVTEKVNAPVGQVWALLSDFHSLPRRMAGIKDFVVEGSGVGTVRSFRLGDGPVIRERIEAFEPERHRFAYSLLPPAFVENYLAEIALVPDGTDACTVMWSATCSVPTESEAAERRAFFENVFRNGIAWVRKELKLA